MSLHFALFLFFICLTVSLSLTFRVDEPYFWVLAADGDCDFLEVAVYRQVVNLSPRVLLVHCQQIHFARLNCVLDKLEHLCNMNFRDREVRSRDFTFGTWRSDGFSFGTFVRERRTVRRVDFSFWDVCLRQKESEEG